MSKLNSELDNPNGFREVVVILTGHYGHYLCPNCYFYGCPCLNCNAYCKNRRREKMSFEEYKKNTTEHIPEEWSYKDYINKKHRK